ncbi:MAG: hypothetical protein ACLTDF_10860 [Coprococcus sp.]
MAMSMILYPDLLIADEPTTSLGITIQAEIIDRVRCRSRPASPS